MIAGEDCLHQDIIIMDVCSFCYANGESEIQYRSHTLKTPGGAVRCPVLRSYVCPFCKATGDQAHTQRYCPMNKNAAGNYPSYKRLAALAPSYMKTPLKVPNNIYEDSKPSLEELTSSMEIDDRNKKNDPKFPSLLKMSSDPNPRGLASPFIYQHPGPVTEPLPRVLRPVTPPPVLPDQPACSQLTMYRHYQYLQFYREKVSEHQAEINRLHALKSLHAKQLGGAGVKQPQQSYCYVRSFPPPHPMSLSPSGSPRAESFCSDAMELEEKYRDIVMMEEKMFPFNYRGAGRMKDGEDKLSEMLAELREGSEEF